MAYGFIICLAELNSANFTTLRFLHAATTISVGSRQEGVATLIPAPNGWQYRSTAERPYQRFHAALVAAISPQRSTRAAAWLQRFTSLGRHASYRSVTAMVLMAAAS